MISDSTDIATIASRKSHGSTYKEESLIGNGAYGMVYKGRDLNNPDLTVAMKRITIRMDNGLPHTLVREIGIAKQMGKHTHPNVVQLLDVCNGAIKPGDPFLTIFLVFEFIEMDLAKYIQTAPAEELNSDGIKRISYHILNGVDFLHKNRIIHRDLKPQNILVSPKGEVKLADFGLAKIYESSMRLTSTVVTLWYRPPEALLGSGYGFPLDLWSFGCIFAELFMRKAIFRGDSEKEQLEKIFDVIGTPEDEEWPAAAPVLLKTFLPRPPRLLDAVVRGLCPLSRDLLQKLLSFAPTRRPTSWVSLSHNYFSPLNQPPPVVSTTTTPKD